MTRDPFTLPARTDGPQNERALNIAVGKMLAEYHRDTWAFKVHGGGVYQRPNIPDWLICRRGLLLAVELKHPTDLSEGPTPGQQRELEWLERAGAETAVCRSVREVEALLTALRR